MSRLVTSAGLTLTRQYLTQPDKFWAGASDRQIRKLSAMKRDRMAQGASEADVVDELLAVAQLRTRHAPPPICLANIGSSGSHWLEAMLGRCAPIISCGEVYLPNGLLQALRPLTPTERAFFLHALYAAHSGLSGNALMGGAFVNSAHYSKVSRVAGLVEGTHTVLLVRNPIDVVLSRTWRKQEYRDEVAPGESDSDYLERNCALVERFYAEASTEPFDLRVRYEDLVGNPRAALSDLLSGLGLDVDPQAIEAAVAATDSKAAAAAAARGEKMPTNLYMGPSDEPDQALLAQIRTRLAACAASLGYSPWG